MKINGRENSIDIFRGILIICVVLGHAFTVPLIYQFNMPLFFLISGYLYRYPYESSLLAYFKKTLKRHYIPFVSYYVLITIIGLNSNFDFKQIIKMVYGGRIIDSSVGVWWFASCLFVSLILYTLFLRYVKNAKVRQVIMAISIVAAYVESGLFTSQYYSKVVPTYLCFPLNIDTALITVPILAGGGTCERRTGSIVEILGKKCSLCVY